MNTFRSGAMLLVLFCGFAVGTQGQVDEICGEFGIAPSMDNPFTRVPYVFGRVEVNAFGPVSKFPKIVISLVESQQAPQHATVQQTGNYCFRRSSSNSATLIVEIEGAEVARRSISSFGTAQQREDFQVAAKLNETPSAAPSSVSAKFSRPPNPRTIELYRRAAEAEQEKDLRRASSIMNQVVTEDPDDFLGWAKLGTIHFELNGLSEAEAAFRRSLAIKMDYPAAWVNMGKMRYAQKQYEAAVEIFKHALTLEPTSARIHSYLGEAYLQLKKGGLGAEALNEAIRLDPIGMAELHLRLAQLYELAKAPHLAAREYRLFLGKVPEYKERKKLERFIRENPEGQTKK